MMTVAQSAVSHAELPDAKTLARQLRETTECLAAELTAPSTVIPEWNALQWRIARATAVIHGISPLLATRQRWSGPADWQAFLNDQRQQVAQRQQRIERLLTRIDASARACGVVVLMLKGAALHRMGFYQPGERPMADIDLLVSPAQRASLAELLGGLGYHKIATSWRHDIFDPGGECSDPAFGEQADASIKIEVHTRIAERLPWTEVDITRRLMQHVVGCGLHHHATLIDLLQHQLLHAAGNMSSRWLRLLQLHDLSLIAASMTADHWREWLRRSQQDGNCWWAYPPLRLTARYFPGSVPDDVLAAAARTCPLALRRMAATHSLTDVSSSSLWVSAAPAWRWARSPGELFRYLLHRVFPPARDMAMNSRFSAAQSGHPVENWYASSQLRRILWWLSGRPPRPQIMYALKRA